jgi:hypothetical protein
MTINLPAGARLVANVLYDTKDPACLTDDLALVELPDSTYIDVSWKPELDPAGSYVVTVYRDSWDNPLERLKSRDPSEVVGWVETLAGRYGG